MNIVVVGLGIIGGSMAKALTEYTDCHVIGINRSEETLQKALECGAIHEIGTTNSLKQADMIILGTYPEVAVEFVRKNAHKIPHHCIVTDTSGIKSKICPALSALAKEYGFTFVGCHPMAGKEKNGFDVSEATLFRNASCIILPCDAPQSAVDTVSALMSQLGFARIVYTTPEEHDRMISFTSQLPHVIACGYVFSPCCMNHKGFSAGSYRDVSRVANINGILWSELFIENKEPLLAEIDTFIENITRIRNSIEKGNRTELAELLSKGKQIKEALGE